MEPLLVVDREEASDESLKGTEQSSLDLALAVSGRRPGLDLRTGGTSRDRAGGRQALRLAEGLRLAEQPGVGGRPALLLQQRAHRLPHLRVVVVQPADLREQRAQARVSRVTCAELE